MCEEAYSSKPCKLAAVTVVTRSPSPLRVVALWVTVTCVHRCVLREAALPHVSK